jgi:hypothetical protein
MAEQVQTLLDNVKELDAKENMGSPIKRHLSRE